MDLNEKIKLIALKNAYKYGGTANKGSVIGGLLGDMPELKRDMKRISKQIDVILESVNSMSEEEQEKRIRNVEPEFFEEKSEEKSLFDSYNIQGDVVSAFPPGPEKHPHIGHAKAMYINYLLAKEHDGKFILRFEDTNPEKVKNEYYEGMIEDFSWFGIKWDSLSYASDHMELFYEKAEEGIKKGLFYMCNTPAEQISRMRRQGMENPCSLRSTTENLTLWQEYIKGDHEAFTLRANIGMEHENSAMRDPVMFRRVEATHPRHGDDFVVWPTYDFQNSVMDGLEGVTHRFRSKEFEMRNELHRFLQRELGYNETNIFEFARFNIEGVESSGRVIREKIESEEFTGWDDPRLSTIKALWRRGFQPEALKNFLVKTGLSKSESTVTWDDLYVQNRKVLDSKARRYFLIEDPVEIDLEGFDDGFVELPKHPSKDEGARKLTLGSKILVNKKDFEALKKDTLYRLMGACNVTYDGTALTYHCNNLDLYKQKGEGALHYLPTDEHLDAVLIIPDKKKKVVVESNVLDETIDSVVMFERFGFARLDSKDDLTFYFSHK